jgi:hypothetical protein
VHEVACEKARNRTDKNVHFVRLGTEHFKVLILVRDTFSIGEGPLSCSHRQAADARAFHTRWSCYVYSFGRDI